jgi:nascent polypeptide-associated complex subunit alpha
VKSQKSVLFNISNPEVFRVGNSDNYIVLGALKMDDTNLKAQQKAADQFKTDVPTQPVDQAAIPDLVSQLTKEAAKIPEVKPPESSAEGKEEDKPVDTTGLNEDEIKIVMEQGNCSKARAVEALRANDGDYIQAIISLSK